MAVQQAAVCAESGHSGIFLTLSLLDGGATGIRRLAAALPDLTERIADQTGEQSLCCALGVGATAWTPIFGDARPAELVPFKPLAEGSRQAPATRADLFLHLHSECHDANFLLARRLMVALAGHARLEEEIHGFRGRDGRDLIGFVDGTENPQGGERAEAALVGDEDAAFRGGSYVSLQRWVHDLPRWEALSVPEQERTVGRSKVDDQELGDKPPFAHIARVVIEENGEELQVLRHSMPYGTTSEHGLYFIAYGRSPRPFRLMLERMVHADGQGFHDRLMDYTRPVTGAAFFTPPEEMLRAL